MVELYYLKAITESGDLDSFLAIEEQWLLNPTAKEVYRALKNSYDSEGVLLTPAELSMNFNINVLEALENKRITKHAIKTIEDRFRKHKFYSGLYDIINESDLAPFDEVIDEVTNLTMRSTEEREVEKEIYDVSLMEEEDTKPKKPCGLGKFDIVNGGMSYGELMLLGGFRGSGKSILLCNMALFNFLTYKETTAILSIEMSASELFPRIVSILTGIPISDIIHKRLSEDDQYKILLKKVVTFCEVNDASNKFKEQLLSKSIGVIEANKIYNALPRKAHKLFILDTPGASMSKIIARTNTLKRNGLKWLGVDYLNIISMPGSNADPLDWKGQIQRANDLKNLARKEQIKVIAPFQTSEEGAVKYAKGIEDPVDYSIIFKKSKEQSSVFSLNTAKIRAGKEMSFNLKIDYTTLKVSPFEEGLTQHEPDNS